jgi:hypothetical protein
MRLKRRHIREARRRSDLADKIPSNASAIVKVATALIIYMGWRLQPKPGLLKGGWKWATTLRRTVWLQAGWPKYSTAKKARVLMHELVHIRQRRRLGHARFVARWLRTRYRWALETAAYRETIRTMRAMGASDKTIRAAVNHRVAKLRTSYRLKSIRRKQYERETRRILMAS